MERTLQNTYDVYRVSPNQCSTDPEYRYSWIVFYRSFSDKYSPRQLGSPMEAHGGEPQLLNCKSDSSKSFTIRFGVKNPMGSTIHMLTC
jgi:hypothetical protein